MKDTSELASHLSGTPDVDDSSASVEGSGEQGQVESSSLRSFLDLIAERDPLWEETRRQELTHFHDTARQLGVSDAQIRVGACPLVVSGVWRGRFFYLRERHDVWRVTVAGGDDPAADVWVTHTERVEDLAEGSAADIYNAEEPAPSAALRLAVEVLDWFTGSREEHDPLCPFGLSSAQGSRGFFLRHACQCALIAKVEDRVRNS